MKCLVIGFHGFSLHYLHDFLMMHYYHWVQTDMVELLQCYPLPLHPNLSSTSLGLLLQPSLHSFPAFDDVTSNRAHKQEVSWQEVKKCNFGAPYLASFKFIFVIFDVFHHYASTSLYFNQNMHRVKSHRSYPLRQSKN